MISAMKQKIIQERILVNDHKNILVNYTKNYHMIIQETKTTLNA